MHDTRNFIVVLICVGAIVWAFLAWLVFSEEAGTPFIWGQRIGSIIVVLGAGAWLLYAFKFEDKLPDRLGEQVGGMYYGSDGVTFMPTVRKTDEQAELCVYYQNNHENPVQVIVHLRPPDDSFIIRPGVHDVHFAFKASGGDFGVIRQPIAVPEHLQGEVIEVYLAAASYFPRSKGSRLRKNAGLPCGSMLVDWGGSAFKTGVHEVSGEIELNSPATLHLSMPKGVNAFLTGTESWRQECIAEGAKS
jgi:hypothetical protein